MFQTTLDLGIQTVAGFIPTSATASRFSFAQRSSHHSSIFSYHSLHSRATSTSPQGDGGFTHEEGHRTSTSYSRVLQSHVRHSQQIGVYRPVSNLRALKQFVVTPHFKMETLQTVVKLIQPGDYLKSIDLMDAFLHILVHRQSHRYLCFHWEGQTFQFRTALFGLSVVSWLFTRLTKPILSWARGRGIRLSAYLDDWLIMVKSATEATAHASSVMNLLRSLA